MTQAPRPPARPTIRRGALGIARVAAMAALAVVASAYLARAGDESAAPAADAEALAFRVRSGPGRSLSLAALRSACGERKVEVDDPYHSRHTAYLALPLRCVLDQGFGERGGAESLVGESVLLRARDGYTRSAPGAKLLEPGAFLAFGEPGLEEPGSGRPRFSPIDRRQVDPAPFYLVWTGVARENHDAYPWPYQLVTIEIASFEEAFPNTVPRGLAMGDAGWKGYVVFQEACSACHSINGEGGKVGPELNVPQSIVEYRPLAQIRAYIRNPQATRYTSMPPHPQFSDRVLDSLIAYFKAMSARKHDPFAGAGS